MKLTQLLTVPNLFQLEVTQKCQHCQLCVLWENFITSKIKGIADSMQCNVLFLSAFGIKLDVKMRDKESLECGRMHIWPLKTQKLPGPLREPWILATQVVHYACMTLLHNKLRPQKLPPPPLPRTNPGPELGRPQVICSENKMFLHFVHVVPWILVYEESPQFIRFSLKSNGSN